MPPQGNRPVGADFERIKARYVATCPNSRGTTRYSQLVDAVTRQKLFENPRLDYRQALHDVLRTDEELKRGYADE